MQSARNFANKIWNAARFVLTVNPGAFDGEIPTDLPSRWIAARLNSTITEVTRALEAYEFESAASTLYSFIWGDFCDWFLETSKPQLREGDQKHAAFMAHILENAMRLLHPFMPFISEEIWAKLPHDGESLALANWPTAASYPLSGNEESDFALVQDCVRASRNLRTQAQLPPGKKLNMTFVAEERTDGIMGNLLTNGYLVAQLANLENISIVGPGTPKPDNAIAIQTEFVEIFLPLEGLIDVEKEKAKLEKQIETAQKDWEKVNTKLSNSSFVDKAPREVVEKEEGKRTELAAQIEKLRERLAAL
jgi:valyl-tRNA synthetase